jgi:hypothetical protein
VSYDCHDAGGGNGVLIQDGKLRCSAISYCGRYGEIPHCKKKDRAVLPAATPIVACGVSLSASLQLLHDGADVELFQSIYFL